jgi:hypothetical protein
MIRNLRKWIAVWLHGGPHFIIGTKADPYLYRWYVIPRNPWLNIYLHKFLRDDEDRALHDHPWWFVSLILKGGYFEVTPTGTIERGWLSLGFRPALWRHRVVLPRAYGDNHAVGRMVPAWTLVITGRKVREWGFWCPKGFVVWTEFTMPGDYGQVGKGCE